MRGSLFLASAHIGVNIALRPSNHPRRERSAIFVCHLDRWERSQPAQNKISPFGRDDSCDGDGLVRPAANRHFARSPQMHSQNPSPSLTQAERASRRLRRWLLHEVARSGLAACHHPNGCSGAASCCSIQVVMSSSTGARCAIPRANASSAPM